MNSNGPINVDVAWDGQIAGTVIIEGDDPERWGWRSKKNLASCVMENQHGQLPNFIKYLTVEGELAKILSSDAEQQQLVKKGLRFLCNVRMGITERSLTSIVADKHTLHLDECTDDGSFIGDLILPDLSIMDPFSKLTGKFLGATSQVSDAFAYAIEESYKDSLTPKFSGFQLKMPMTLSENPETKKSELSTAKETPFTHILKVGSSNHLRETIPIAEWVGLELSEASGLDTCAHALIKLPKVSNNSADIFGLVVERFDIRKAGEDPNIGYYMADMCSVAGVKPKSRYGNSPDKYGTPVEDVAYAVLHSSSNASEDAKTLFRRVVFGFTLADMDMHLKNISMLSTVDKKNRDIKIRMAPTYDAVPTRIYPDQEYRMLDIKTGGQKIYFEPDDKFSLPINGKYKDITEDDFYALAEGMGIDPVDAQDIIFDVAVACVERAIEIAKTPPEVLKNHRDARFILWRTASEVADQVKALTQMEYYDDLEGNYYTYKDYSAFCKKFKSQNFTNDDTLDV